MNSKLQTWIVAVTITCAALAFSATRTYAQTDKQQEEESASQMMQQGMPGGMGPGMGMMGGGMGPGSMRQGGMGPGGMGMMNMMGGMGMMQMLDLDKNQRAKVREMMRTQRASHCKTMVEMMDIRDEIAEQYDKDEPDAKAIGKLYDQLYAKQRNMIEQHIEMRNKVRALLNKEQKEKFDRMHRGGMGMMNMMGGGMGQGGMGMKCGGMMNMMQ